MTTRKAAVTVFGSAQTSPGTAEWAQAEATGSRLARAGLDVVTGGYGGTMEAVSKGASDAGGHTIGVTAPSQFPQREGANRYIAEVIEASDLTHRIGLMIDRARAAIALPGSIGTATELLIAWNINHIVRRNGGTPFPTAAVGPNWEQFSQSLALHIDAYPGDIHLSDNADQAVDWIFEQLEIREI
ncbi:MAG: LOG family protein [Actinomycetota bacterium]|nr:LOG family protein [Actinomycetota bacterium]